ncbi:hypothetical protein HQ590_00680, partial [bacterium]|nr:hypothetical protein [bacterium]
SNAVLEALAAGVPVVTTETGIAAELAARTDTAIVSRTIEGIETGIERFLGPMIARRQAMVSNYKWEAIAQQYARLYAEVIG